MKGRAMATFRCDVCGKEDTEETANQLMQLSAKARENGQRYASLTATNAAAAVERKGQGRG